MSVVVTLLILNLLIFVHEFGHYIVARAAGVHVKEFAVGFGKKIFSFDRNGTTYSLRMIPMGGFCSLQGMLEEDKGEEGNFIDKPVLWRMLIVVAGAAMNILLAIILLFIMGLVVFETPIHITALATVKTAGFIVKSIFSSLQGIAIEGTTDFVGPIGMVAVVGEAMKTSGMLLFYTALISINLGIVNLLPIPGLDGSRILFLIIEVIQRKPINPKKEAIVHGIGAVFLLILMVLITYQDIIRFL